MKTLSIDIETYSDNNIKLGVYKYVDSPSFKILLFAYSIDGLPAEIVDLKNGEKIPINIYKALTDSSIEKKAFNAQFERVCLDKYLGIKTKNWKCTMIKAWMCGIGGGLQAVGTAIGLSEEEGKLKVGKKLIDIFCTPKKVRFINSKEEDWELFKSYCKRDVDVEVKIATKLENFTFPNWEYELYDLDQKINDAGIKLDLIMANSAVKIDEDLQELSSLRFKELTGMDNPKSLKDIKSFIKQRTGSTVSAITKESIPELKQKFKNYPDVVEVLDIRKNTSKTSTAKYQMMKDIVLSDGRSRGNIQHYGAYQTGRWAGRLLQVHNLPRNHLSDLDIANKAIKLGDYDFIKMLYNDVPDVLRQCIRTAIIPEDGNKFLVADYSAIEARVIAWLAGEDWVIDVFKTTGKIYEAAAARMFNIPIESITKGSDMRQRGKVATLALGYQGGVGALKAMGALEMGIPEDELQGLVDSWRNANSKIVEFWKEADSAVKTAINERISVDFANGKCKAYVFKGILWITLPSGRNLAYPKPKIEPHETWEFAEKITFKSMASSGTTWINKDTYGGKLVENIVQATARDILGYSLLQLDKAGYKIVMHVHDEVIIEINKDSKDLEAVCEIMGKPPMWANDLPLRADGYECDYYKKD